MATEKPAAPPAPPAPVAAPVAPVYVPPATREEAVQRMIDDGDADPEGTAAMNWPELFKDAVPSAPPAPAAEKAAKADTKAQDDKARRVPSTNPYEGRIAVGPIPEDA